MQNFSSSEFTWHAGKGCAERSDLGFKAGMPLPANFAVVSERTGARREFFRHQTAAMDAQVYVTFDKLPTITITLFND